MNEPTRTAWGRPELIVIVRGRPEEAVLGVCKEDTQRTGQSNVLTGCMAGPQECGSQCQNSLASYLLEVDRGGAERGGAEVR